MNLAMAKQPGRSRLARTLRVLRAERELTQQVLSARIGMTQTRYWQIEHGEGAPLRKDERAAIARQLEVAPHDIAWPEMKPTQLQVSRAAARAEREEQRRAAALLTAGDRA
jgi:transcriptional regulator with XRE-family HTH domain